MGKIHDWAIDTAVFINGSIFNILCVIMLKLKTVEKVKNAKKRKGKFEFLYDLEKIRNVLLKQKRKVDLSKIVKLTGMKYQYIYLILNYPVAENTYSIQTEKYGRKRKYWIEKVKK